MSTMDMRRYELATLAAARRLGSSYCMLGHGKVLADWFMTPTQVFDASARRRTPTLPGPTRSCATS